jgi:N-acetylmuramoyl-L-alanine amidase
MKSVYITAGHQILKGKGTGASSPSGDEAIEARNLVQSLIVNLKEKGVVAYTDNDSWDLRGTIQWLLGKLKDADLSIDIHFNASDNIDAHGCEVIIPNIYTMEEKSLAEVFTNGIASTIRVKNRGVKTEALTAHKTLGILRQPKIATNILLEICFITNEEDMKNYRLHYNQLVDNLVTTILQYLTRNK